MIDKAYCINLDHRTDRWEHFLGEQRFLNIPITRFEAINGKTCGLHQNIPPHEGWTVMSYGNLGDVLSHREIIKASIKGRLNNVLILEDDVEFDKSVDINKFLSLIPNDWDMIYFGGNHQQPLTPISDIVGRCSLTLTTHAVLIKKTAFYKILDITQSLYAPIDLYYAMLQEHYKVYAPMKAISWQIDGYSDIEDKPVTYEHLK